LRQYSYQKKESLIMYKVKGKKWDWLNDFPASYRSFVIAIHKKQSF